MKKYNFFDMLFWIMLTMYVGFYFGMISAVEEYANDMENYQAQRTLSLRQLWRAK